ncbi:MAG: hypothetical protein ACRDKW_03395 [Actinomycetota bacterium]
MAERLGQGRPGLRARLFRLIHEFADELDLIECAAEHVQKGGFILIAPADESGKATVASILARHGAHDMIHNGKGHWERLGA